MDFPAYVPAPLQAFFTLELNRLHSLLEAAQKCVADLEHLIATGRDISERQQPHDAPSCLHKRLAISSADQDSLHEKIDCVRKLAGLDDERIRDAYEILAAELGTDQQWLNFFRSAYFSAVQNFAEYRDRRRLAEDLIRDIVADAKSLAAKVRRLQRTGIALPPEVMSHSEFLSTGPSEIEQDLFLQEVIRHMRVHGSLNLRQTTHVDLVCLLGAVAEKLPATHPCFDTCDGAVDAAISKQKNNFKTEHLRAFAHLLSRSETDGAIALTLDVRRAMAFTATTVIGSDVIVTAEDVRKAIETHARAR